MEMIWLIFNQNQGSKRCKFTKKYPTQWWDIFFNL